MTPQTSQNGANATLNRDTMNTDGSGASYDQWVARFNSSNYPPAHNARVVHSTRSKRQPDANASASTHDGVFAARNPEPFRFLDLPPELRNMVYDQVFTDKHHLGTHPLNKVSQQLRQETLGFFYSGVTTREIPLHNIAQMNHFLNWAIAGAMHHGDAQPILEFACTLHDGRQQTVRLEREKLNNAQVLEEMRKRSYPCGPKKAAWYYRLGFKNYLPELCARPRTRGQRIMERSLYPSPEEFNARTETVTHHFTLGSAFDSLLKTDDASWFTIALAQWAYCLQYDGGQGMEVGIGDLEDLANFLFMCSLFPAEKAWYQSRSSSKGLVMAQHARRLAAADAARERDACKVEGA